MKFAFDSEIAWFGVSLAVLIIAIVISRRFSKNTLQFMGDLKRMTEKNSSEIQQIIDKELSPSIHLHDGAVSVATRAAYIIREVANERDPVDRQIAFYGAAALASMAEGTESTNDDPESQSKSPSTIYRNAIDLLRDKTT